MRHEPNLRLEQARIDGPQGTNYGRFQVGPLLVLIAAGAGWDHVSVSGPRRVPTWAEMCRIKALVFRDDEVVMQLHVDDARKVNHCVFCLHLWRPQTEDEIAAERARWTASGEPWPEDVTCAGAIPLPPQALV